MASRTYSVINITNEIRRVSGLTLMIRPVVGEILALQNENGKTIYYEIINVVHSHDSEDPALIIHSLGPELEYLDHLKTELI